jgi:hypothetical protein
MGACLRIPLAAAGRLSSRPYPWPESEQWLQDDPCAWLQCGPHQTVTVGPGRSSVTVTVGPGLVTVTLTVCPGAGTLTVTVTVGVGFPPGGGLAALSRAGTAAAMISASPRVAATASTALGSGLRSFFR